ncbi:MAG TPA: sigma-70 family RNA polymerase sigma factor [Fimbriimonadaceae bacterium]|nr:sigma-70 family RNA polymerase sigma factor [Fimbriimonadaceae bacterium]
MFGTRAVVNPVSDTLSDDLHWLERCRQGDDAAVTYLVNKHRNRLVRTAANILRDRFEAEDVAQDAFLKAFRELHRLRDDRAFASFLYRICVRLCMDRLRSKRAEPAEFDGVESSDGPQIETRIVVEELLETLTPELRMTLVLREMEQLSYEEVAEIMHVPIGTVRSRLHTARERFRHLWLDANKETA